MPPDISQGPRELVESDTNKTGFDPENGGKPRTLLTVDIEDSELLKLTRDWEREWKTYWATEEKLTKEAEEYWKGKQYTSIERQNSRRPLVDNLIFESLETFLPEATKQSAEPVVMADQTPEGRILERNIKTSLQFLADKLRLRLKLKRQARYWAIYKLGAIKVGWSPDTKQIFTDVVRTRKLILEKDATIDDGGIYTGEYIGEYKEATAKRMIELFPDKKTEIDAKAQGQDGSKIKYIEWWTAEMLFFTMDEIVLDKYRNPHWNYDSEDLTIDEYGNATPINVNGSNHFDSPQIPYVFLSVYNLGDHPLDDTSLILQNLSAQDMVNTLSKQIVRNVRKMNGGSAFASESFTKEEAREAQSALDSGDGVWVPTGDINAAFKQYQGTPLPSDVYGERADARSELRNIFGVKGSSAQGVASEQTVRGKLVISQKDSSRIGGGVSEYIEQCADRIFNWWVQLMYVYYDEPHYAAVLGTAKAQQTIQLKNKDLSAYTGELLISVKEGSMLPKDDVTKANQAIDLATAGFLSPIDLYDALDFPDPKETARNLFIWQNMPQTLFPELMQGMMPPGMPGAPMAPQTGPIPGAPVQADTGAPPPEGAPPLPPIPNQ
jgi:hypothetical protein